LSPYGCEIQVEAEKLHGMNLVRGELYLDNKFLPGAVSRKEGLHIFNNWLRDMAEDYEEDITLIGFNSHAFDDPIIKQEMEKEGTWLTRRVTRHMDVMKIVRPYLEERKNSVEYGLKAAADTILGRTERQKYTLNDAVEDAGLGRRLYEAIVDEERFPIPYEAIKYASD